MIESNQKLQMGECLELMRRIPDNSYDLAIVDPPQGNGEARRISKKSGQTSGGHPVAKGNYDLVEWDNERPGPEYFQELFRISKNKIIWCAIYYTDLLPASRGWIVWDKCNGSSSFGDCELAWTSFDQPVRKVTFMWNGHQQGRSLKNEYVQQGNKKLNEKRIHPTQKPVKLYEWILENYAKPGDRIIDTHAGSASSLIACYNLNFEALGIEVDPAMHRKASDRLWKVQRQLRAFITNA